MDSVWIVVFYKPDNRTTSGCRFTDAEVFLEKEDALSAAQDGEANGVYATVIETESPFEL